jgi:glutaminase
MDHPTVNAGFWATAEVVNSKNRKRKRAIICSFATQIPGRDWRHSYAEEF